MGVLHFSGPLEFSIVLPRSAQWEDFFFLKIFFTLN